MDNSFTAKNLNQKSNDPTYAGATSFMRRKYSKDVKGTDLVVWGIPFDAAVSNRPGTRFGPRAVREASVSMDNDPQYPFGTWMFDKVNVIDYGDCEFDYGYHSQAPNKIAEQASKIISSESEPYLLSIGGDHFVTYPLLKAHAQKYGPLALVQFDAHQDTWDDDDGRIDHGTMITRAIKDGLIVPDKSIQIGIRTIAHKDYGIKILDSLRITEMNADEVVTEIKKRINGSNVYLTFDIDCLDPAFAPGTGTPVAGGLSTSHALNILRKLNELNIVGSDVVEVSPPYDHADITALAAATIAMYMLGLVVNKK